MTKTGWLVLVIIIAVVAGGLLWWSSSSAPASVDQGTATNTIDTTLPPDNATTSGNTTTSPAPSPSPSAFGSPMTVTVLYDGNSFSPSTVNIAAGGIVTFTDTVGQMWVASNQHPSHTGYDGTARSTHCAAGYSGAKPFDQCGGGTSYSFTFNKAGSWGYHDHMNAGAQGVINVGLAM